MNLEQVLKGETPPAVVEAAVTPEVKVEAPVTEKPQDAKPDRSRDEKGKFAKGETTDSPPVKTEEHKPSDEVSGLKAGISAERKKRQELERQLAEFQKARENPPPDVIQDPDGFRKHLQGELQARLVDEKVNMSAAWAKKTYKDFDEVMGQWPAMLQEQPWLYEQAVKQELPAEWAYQQVKRHQFLSEVGDPDDYKARTRKSIEDEIRKQLTEEFKTQRSATPTPSLANAAGSGRMSEPAYGGPPSLNDIFKRK